MNITEAAQNPAMETEPGNTGTCKWQVYTLQLSVLKIHCITSQVSVFFFIRVHEYTKLMFYKFII